MEDHRTSLNSLLFWILEMKCEHESMGVTIIVQSPHYDQSVQVWRETIFNITPSHWRSLARGVTMVGAGRCSGYWHPAEYELGRITRSVRRNWTINVAVPNKTKQT